MKNKGKSIIQTIITILILGVVIFEMDATAYAKNKKSLLAILIGL